MIVGLGKLQKGVGGGFSNAFLTVQQALLKKHTGNIKCDLYQEMGNLGLF